MKRKVAAAKQAVKWIATHYRFHVDEGLAIWMAKRFGAHTFNGVSDALKEGRLFFCDAGRELPLWRLPCERDALLEVGIGGREFDEHNAGQDGTQCAATLMQRRIGRYGDRALNQMVQWALRNDQKALGVCFDWADITNAYFHAGASEQFVLKRSLRVYTAVYNYLSSNLKRRDITSFPTYWELSAEFVQWFARGIGRTEYTDPEQHYFANALSAARVLRLEGDERISWILNHEVETLERGRSSRESSFMGIPTVVRALCYDGASEGEVRRIVHHILLARLKEQKIFLSAVDELAPVLEAIEARRPHPKGKLLKVKKADVTYKVMLIFSDNPRIVSAVRSSSVRPHIIVRVLPKTGHISVFTRHMDVTPIVSRWRNAIWTRERKVPPLTRQECEQEWTIQGVPHLCYQRNAGNILNSSFTAPHVPAVPLSVRESLSVILDGVQEMARKRAQHRKSEAERRKLRNQAVSVAL